MRSQRCGHHRHLTNGRMSRGRGKVCFVRMATGMVVGSAARDAASPRSSRCRSSPRQDGSWYTTSRCHCPTSAAPCRRRRRLRGRACPPGQTAGRIRDDASSPAVREAGRGSSADAAAGLSWPIGSTGGSRSASPTRGHTSPQQARKTHTVPAATATPRARSKSIFRKAARALA